MGMWVCGQAIQLRHGDARDAGKTQGHKVGHKWTRTWLGWDAGMPGETQVDMDVAGTCVRGPGHKYDACNTCKRGGTHIRWLGHVYMGLDTCTRAAMRGLGPGHMDLGWDVCTKTMTRV